MGIGDSRGRSNLRSETQFVQLVMLTWFCFFYIVNEQNINGFFSYLAFALGATTISFFLLKMIGYFDPLRLVPRKSDLLSVVFAIPLAAVAFNEGFARLCGSPLCASGTTMFWTPLLATIIFGSHYWLSRYMLKHGRKRKIVLELLDQEKSDIIESFAERNIAEHLEFLSLQDLRKHILEGRSAEISLIIISRQAVVELNADAILIRAHLSGIPIVDFKKVIGVLNDRILLSESDLWSYVMEATPQTLPLRAFSATKVVIEPIIAVVLGILLSPLLVAVAIAIKLTSRGPVLYKQTRTGFMGHNFVLVKFRSMNLESEKDGPRWAAVNDERLTPIGQFIRKTRIDELPQLWNVFLGQMSFFGPRPERPEIYAKLRTAIPLFAMRLIVRPGITGWAQVCAGYAASVSESTKKLEYDLFYIQHMSPRLDFIILLKTLKVAFFGHERIEGSVTESVRAIAVENN